LNTRILWVIMTFTFVLGCSRPKPNIIRVIDRKNMKMLVFTEEKTRFKNIYDADFVIIGGGLGGIAATIAACSSGRSAILIEETDRIAACFAPQDTALCFDNRFVGETGSSIRYRTFRSKIKDWYEKKSQPQPELFSTPFADFEDFGSNNFCFGSEAAIDVINEMLENHIERERLTILKRHKIAEVIYYKQRIASFNVVDLDNKTVNQVTGWMFIDATETGDILPLAGIKYTIGRESRADTGEPHAPDTADSLDAIEYYYYRDADTSNDENYYEINLLKEKPVNADSMKNIALVKEPRRINAFTRIVEQDISAEHQRGPRARFYRDSVGIGYSPINIPPLNCEIDNLIIETKPFQIPLTALIPHEFTNFLSAGRTIGTTYITSTAYSAPSVVWAIGEGAGEIAAFCAGHNFTTHDLMKSEADLKFFRNWLVKNYSIPVYWYDDVAPDDSDFTEAQMKPFDDPDYHESAKTLHFRE